jgi:hypothetical protein
MMVAPAHARGYMAARAYLTLRVESSAVSPWPDRDCAIPSPQLRGPQPLHPASGGREFVLGYLD